MFKFIYQKIFPKKKLQYTKKKSRYNKISFYIDTQNQSNINIDFHLSDKKLSESFGKLLYLINSGSLEQTILDSMVELSNKKPHLKESIQLCLLCWANLIKNNIQDQNKLNNTQPYIKPTEVFNVSNQQ